MWRVANGTAVSSVGDVARGGGCGRMECRGGGGPEWRHGVVEVTVGLGSEPEPTTVIEMVIAVVLLLPSA